MKVLLFDDNLMWTTRFTKTLRSLGHEVELATGVPDQTDAQAAILNLGSPKIDAAALVPALQLLGVRVIGHAGHKEKELHALGKAVGCDVLATNRQITVDLEGLLGP